MYNSEDPFLDQRNPSASTMIYYVMFAILCFVFVYGYHSLSTQVTRLATKAQNVTSTTNFLYATRLNTSTQDLVCVFDVGQGKIGVPCITPDNK